MDRLSSMAFSVKAKACAEGVHPNEAGLRRE